MPARRLPRLLAVPVYLALRSLAAAFFLVYSTVSAIYRIREAGLNPLELVLVGTALEMSVFLFEVPTGVAADVYGRRLSVAIGIFVVGVGFIVEGLNPSFGYILLAQVIWGLGYTFTSGARDAWLVDELRGEGIGSVFLRGAQLGQLGALLGIAASVALASISLALPLVVAGCLMIALALFVAIAMPEEGFPGRRRQAGSFGLALAAYLASRVLRQVAAPILDTWMNLQIESSVRATVLSMRAQSDSLGQVVGGPILGVLATAFALRAALLGTALVLVPAQAIYARALRRDVGSSAEPVSPRRMSQ